AGRRRRRGVLPLLRRRGHGLRPDARRRRRLLAGGVMEPTDANRRMFDEAHRRRGEGRTALPPIVRQTLRDLGGKSVLHLPCGSGEGSAELAELGATVTAVDMDEALLDVARERWPLVLWIAGAAPDWRGDPAP